MTEKTKKRNKLLISLVTGIVLSLPVTGFIYGFFACSDCRDGISGFFWRIFIGVIHLFLNIITLGKPWKDESGISSTNLRPYVLLAVVLIAIITYLILSRKEKTPNNSYKA
ncbi:MAG: hypothetical protein CL843_19505 [Crocinitomicaceae bacterium]|nr:hypothetical protein [Crocinitomicaceae bacterium]|tara:strand:- start:1278 stop:1610 length:333 start_codon:yes stop_codon:yes gene_type:complete